MASAENGAKQTPDSSPYSKVFILGTIAAASAFLVTVLIMLLCVGCKRKGKTKKVPAEGVKLMDMNLLRQTKLRSISKSDTRLHEMNKLSTNGKKGVKNRPASMDLLYLPNRKSDWDLRCPQSRQLPKIPPIPGEREHTYSEVRRHSSQPRAPEDALYESVGGRNEPDTAPPPAAPQPNPQNPPQGNGNGSAPPTNAKAQAQDTVTAEYACIRKVRKADKAQQQQPEKGAEAAEQEPRYSSTELLSTHRNHELPRKPIDGFHLHSFPKEAVFMGNGEQYIWKPPEEGDVAPLPAKPAAPPPVPKVDNSQGQLTSVEISEMYSKVCKPTKKKRPPASPPPPTKDSNGHKNQRCPAANAEREEVPAYDANKPPGWAGGAQAVRPGEDPCYESISEKTWAGAEEADPAYETIDANWKRDKPPASQQGKKKKLPTKAHPSENFYESISDVKQGASTSTTTIFMFNDGVEMYVTGL
ncbi:phosphoprotein associated with glycosphingolipid-enriched microdomains 1 [Amia ocellicauda]|uniref:phosphoprotein associated with glycosphingolipid-enriched microdomains 1 n=1 Tax=Amia ocellicauda TaxID=2972642 RepID=UPI0034643D0C